MTNKCFNQDELNHHCNKCSIAVNQRYVQIIVKEVKAETAEEKENDEDGPKFNNGEDLKLDDIAGI